MAAAPTRCQINSPSSATSRVNMKYEKESPPSIMLVEDDDDSRFMMRTLLEMKGYRVVEASDGDQAVNVFEIEMPDLIMMDLQLPRQDGFAVARRVRQHKSLHQTPIIICSGHEPVQHRKLAMAAGCNEYLQKPLDFLHLEETLQRLVPLRRKSGTGSAAQRGTGQVREEQNAD